MKRYDIAVIGAGSGGLKAASLAKQQGARVALLEKNKIGGECTHTGCIPSKTFIHSAKVFHAMRNAALLGLPQLDSDGVLDFAAVMEHVDSVVQDVYLHEWPFQPQDSGVDVIVHPSGAQFMNAHEIQIGGETLRAEHSIICTGSSPAQPPTAGARQLVFLDNESFWKIRELPRSIVFLGGGIIAAELGQSLARFGSQVTIIGRNPRFIKAADKDVSTLAAEILQREGVRIYTSAEVSYCETLDDGRTNICVNRPDGKTEVAAEVIFAALGRVPNVSGLQLENAGVEYDTRRGIHTNPYLQTTAESIYACGDVTTEAKFTHTAGYQATVYVKNILQGNKIVNDLSVLPWAIFMDPEVAHVGLNEEQAREKMGAVQVVRVDATLDRFVTENKIEGFLKVVLDEQDRVVGADAIGAHAGEWIQLIALAIKHNLSPQDFSNTIVAYPTHGDIARKAFNKLLDSKPDNPIAGM
jgi:pyruvate/2-oxoglutarate dehydrogenase complex dihydrolipoamide dehydrogenase (E3) component